ncbi:MAG: methyltransferase domain-containing protein [Candidatus Magasanikbacteria bacterium]|nr:methyltransferase domain-containing protein [Candidatus Magasanikbacteria bacterium]
MKKNTSWGKVANWYDKMLEKDNDSFQSRVILPNITRLMNLEKSQTALDLACGQGFFSRIFAEKADKVIASDISPELIKLAQKHSVKNIEYHVAPADNLNFCSNQSVDTIVIILALQNIKNVDGVLKECKRVLKEKGSVCLVLNHPAFRVPKMSSWGWDEEEKVQYRRMDMYLSESQSEIDMHPGQKKSEKTVSFHRSLQWYFKMFSKHGFGVAKCEEWISHREPTRGPRFAAEDRARKEFPLFLFLELRKFEG